MNELSKQSLELLREAKRHIKQRHSETTTIGAAVRTKAGKIYTGINLKYRTRNTSTCAAITALHNALNDGETAFDTIVEVKYFPESDTYEIVNACGLCRQLFAYNTPLNVIINTGTSLEIKSSETLLPYSFL
ncbi:MAG TPA: hypothetical protein VGG13_04235 [Candidatus Saccharimonadales bacterium]|jgi:cytidine deaminase